MTCKIHVFLFTYISAHLHLQYNANAIRLVGTAFIPNWETARCKIIIKIMMIFFSLLTIHFDRSLNFFPNRILTSTVLFLDEDETYRHMSQYIPLNYQCCCSEETLFWWLHFNSVQSHWLHPSVTVMFGIIHMSLVGKTQSELQALLPSRAERDELKWLISIIWLVQLHKHAPILASVSVFLLECATLALMHQTVYPAGSIFMPSTLLLWMARFISTLVRFPRPCVCRLEARGGSCS